MALITAIRRSTHVATTIILVAALGAFLFVLGAQATNRYRFVPVLSGSMSPFVEAGDVAVLEPRQPTELAVGDVIAFEAPVEGSPLTLHRVSEIVSPAPDLVIRTKGDANTVDDPWAARLADERLWHATSHIDNLGTPVLFLHRTKTRFLWIAVASLLIGWWGMAAIWRDRTEPPAPDGERTPGPEGERTRSVIPAALVVLIVIGLATSARTQAADASFTAQATGSQLVTSAGARPLQLEADMLCSRTGVPTSVELTWTPASVSTDGYEVYRGTIAGGPYDTLVGRVRGDVLTYADDITDLGGIPLYYVVRTDGIDAPVEESNEAFALGLCDLVEGLAPGISPDIEVTPVSTARSVTARQTSGWPAGHGSALS